MNAVAQPAVAPAAPLDLSFAMEPPISVRGVDKRYDGQTVLAGANLQLEPGAVLGLIGRNGAGKSTLIRVLLGLIEPDAGEARIWGRPALALDDGAKARLGYVPQQPEALGWLKVGDMLDFVGRFYPRWDAAFVDATLERWSLPRNKVLALIVTLLDRHRLDPPFLEPADHRLAIAVRDPDPLGAGGFDCGRDGSQIVSRQLEFRRVDPAVHLGGGLRRHHLRGGLRHPAHGGRAARRRPLPPPTRGR